MDFSVAVREINEPANGYLLTGRRTLGSELSV